MTLGISDIQTTAIRAFFANRQSMFANLCKIVNKEGQVVPLVLNPAQADLYPKLTGRDILLKARQLGFSTLIEADYLLDAVVIPNLRVGVFVQNEEAIPKFMGIFHNDVGNGLYDFLPEVIEIEGVRINLRPELTMANVSTLGLSNGSVINVMTSGGERLGRGQTIHRALFTEMAFWEATTAETIMAAVLGAMPPKGTKLVIESTAFGEQGPFFAEWNAARQGHSDFTPHFYDWSWAPEYRVTKEESTLSEEEKNRPPTLEEQGVINSLGLDLEQLLYRRQLERRLRDKRPQEFPETPDEAFITTGLSIFTGDHRALAKRFVCEPLSDVNGLKLWAEPEPERRYLVVVDSSQGITKAADYDAISVFCIKPPYVEHVASWVGRLTQKDVALKAADLATYFNKAMICVEAVDGSGQTILHILNETIKYPRLWAREDGEYGWKTTRWTKPMMIDSFKQLLDQDLFRTYDPMVSEQMGHYVEHRSSNGQIKVGAANGAYDDLLVTILIAAAVIPTTRQGRTKVVHYGRF